MAPAVGTTSTPAKVASPSGHSGRPSWSTRDSSAAIHFRNRIWYPAVKGAGVRQFAPQIMRHTAAPWLAQDGVPLYDVQALLGHEDYATTQRYAHLAPDAHSRVMESWSRRRDASVTHGPESQEAR